MISKQRKTRDVSERFCGLHIGLPKTATKTIQMRLFAPHSQVDYLGTYTGSHRQFQKCRDADVNALINELIWDNLGQPNFDRAQQLFDKSVAPSFDKGLLPVWSWESLVENRPEIQRKRAENLKKVFGNCKIVVGIRHPIRLVESLYLQIMKRNNVGAKASLRYGAWHVPIDDWIAKRWERPGHPPTAQLGFADAIQIYADVFGREQVGVFLYEQLAEDPAEYFASICRFLRIDPDEGVSHALGERENARWTEQQLDRLREIKDSAFLSTAYRFAGKRARRRMLGIRKKDSLPKFPPARAEMSDLWREKIEAKTCPGNRRLAEDWNLPLKKYGYPLGN